MGGDGKDSKVLGRITSLGNKAYHGDDGDTWGGRVVVIPPVVVAMDAVGLHPIGEYISSWLATIAEKVAFCTIYELCVEADRIPGASCMVILWDQDVVNKPEDWAGILRSLT